MVTRLTKKSAVPINVFPLIIKKLTLTYDLLGRRLNMESADAGRSEYVYDRAGNLVEETNSELRKNGQYIRHEYDGMNRLVKTVYPTTNTGNWPLQPRDQSKTEEKTAENGDSLGAEPVDSAGLDPGNPSLFLNNPIDQEKKCFYNNQ